MKKTALHIGGALAALALIAANCEDPEATPAKNFEFGDGIITGYSGDSKDVVIPAKINWKRVTSIGEEAFRRSQLTSVIIPNAACKIVYDSFDRSVRVTLGK
jgi:hypothetical protein